MKVGVVLPSAEALDTNGPPSYTDIRRWARAAEDLGSDSI